VYQKQSGLENRRVEFESHKHLWVCVWHSCG
jgi:hypothetical protein